MDNTGSALGKVLIGLAAVWGVAALLSGSARKVFVSYDHDQDARYRDLLRAWDKNPQFEFQFDLTSPVEAIDSHDKGVVKRALTPKMKAAEYLLVLVGEDTARSKWVEWEIERATEPDVNLKVAAIKLHKSSRLPRALQQIGAASATGFSLDNVTRVLNDARTAQS
jgi:MTH538 TIR-like domain (DUF1863)